MVMRLVNFEIAGAEGNYTAPGAVVALRRVMYPLVSLFGGELHSLRVTVNVDGTQSWEKSRDSAIFKPRWALWFFPPIALAIALVSSVALALTLLISTLSNLFARNPSPKQQAINRALKFSLGNESLQDLLPAELPSETVSVDSDEPVYESEEAGRVRDEVRDTPVSSSHSEFELYHKVPKNQRPLSRNIASSNLQAIFRDGRIAKAVVLSSSGEAALGELPLVETELAPTLSPGEQTHFQSLKRTLAERDESSDLLFDEARALKRAAISEADRGLDEVSSGSWATDIEEGLEPLGRRVVKQKRSRSGSQGKMGRRNSARDKVRIKPPSRTKLLAERVKGSTTGSVKPREISVEHSSEWEDLETEQSSSAYVSTAIAKEETASRGYELSHEQWLALLGGVDSEAHRVDESTDLVLLDEVIPRETVPAAYPKPENLGSRGPELDLSMSGDPDEDDLEDTEAEALPRAFAPEPTTPVLPADVTHRVNELDLSDDEHEEASILDLDNLDLGVLGDEEEIRLFTEKWLQSSSPEPVQPIFESDIARRRAVIERLTHIGAFVDALSLESKETRTTKKQGHPLLESKINRSKPLDLIEIEEFAEGLKEFVEPFTILSEKYVLCEVRLAEQNVLVALDYDNNICLGLVVLKPNSGEDTPTLVDPIELSQRVLFVGDVNYISLSDERAKKAGITFNTEHGVLLRGDEILAKTKKFDQIKHYGKRTLSELEQPDVYTIRNHNGLWVLYENNQVQSLVFDPREIASPGYVPSLRDIKKAEDLKRMFVLPFELLERVGPDGSLPKVKGSDKQLHSVWIDRVDMVVRLDMDGKILIHPREYSEHVMLKGRSSMASVEVGTTESGELSDDNITLPQAGVSKLPRPVKQEKASHRPVKRVRFADRVAVLATGSRIPRPVIEKPDKPLLRTGIPKPTRVSKQFCSRRESTGTLEHILKMAEKLDPVVFDEAGISLFEKLEAAVCTGSNGDADALLQEYDKTHLQLFRERRANSMREAAGVVPMEDSNEEEGVFEELSRPRSKTP